MGISGQTLKCIEKFLKNRLQHVLVNVQLSNGLPVTADVSLDSWWIYLGPFFIMNSTVKLFGDVFVSIANNPDTSVKVLHKDLKLVSKWR